jgi:hypothetical protein
MFSQSGYNPHDNLAKFGYKIVFFPKKINYLFVFDYLLERCIEIWQFFYEIKCMRISHLKIVTKKFWICLQVASSSFHCQITILFYFKNKIFPNTLKASLFPFTQF